jgi:hypothetical protein
VGFTQLWAAFIASLPVVANAWPTVSGLVIAALVVGWLAGRFMYGQRIEDLKTSAQTLRDRIALKDEQIAASASPAEARALIAALEKRLAAIEPYGLASERVAAMLDALKQCKGGILITQDVSAPDALHLFNQVVGTFQDAGWVVTGRQGVMGVSNPPDCGVTLFVHSEYQDSDILKTIRSALNAAHLDFVERAPGSPEATVPHLAFSLRDRNYVPSARWA